jgi:hypothetical protein
MDWCLVAGPVISWVVEAAKRIPWVAAHPKLAAAVLAAIGGALRQWLGADAPWTQLVQCVLQAWGLAVATHEVVTDPVRRLVG